MHEKCIIFDTNLVNQLVKKVYLAVYTCISLSRIIEYILCSWPFVVFNALIP